MRHRDTRTSDDRQPTGAHSRETESHSTIRGPRRSAKARANGGSRTDGGCLDLSRGDSRLLTVDEVAIWLRVRPSTIYVWTSTKRLPCIRLGGRLRFCRDDVLRWIEARKED